MKKILAIDDNEINLVLLNQIIKLYYSDYVFLQATSGKEGIDIAVKEKPEIVLLDILMPEMDGYEVCARLKNNTVTQHIPILMISALGQNPIERTKGLNAGADAFISKPFSQDELRAQIDVVLRIKKAEDLLRKRNESLEVLIKDQTTKYLQSEERYLQISEHALEFYWEVDSKGIFSYVSPVIEKILGQKPDDIIEKIDYKTLFQLKSDKEKVSAIEESFHNQSGFNDYEIELEANGKDKLWLSVSGFSIFNKKDEFYGVRGVCYDITTRKQAEIALKKSLKKIKNYQKKLKKLNTELTLVEEKERRRIAENLHDSLGQTLSLAFIKLSSIANEELPPQAEKVFNEISGLLNKAISESRTLTYDLSPPILYELGLVPAFKWKLEEVEDKQGLKTVLIGEDQKIEIKKEYNIFLYRIVTELLNNVIKHSQADLVELEIKKEKKYYYITVRDNGVGFKKQLNKKASLEGGFGLLSITERLDSIKGHLEIDSAIGKGTSATVIIPTSEG
ncbi:PAS domain S-box-containing protein [Mariniphaga anaerophila]|uniref:PAS domain S-box-containing protein n=1 Tax=Mariniphaga anaerophila TaxID=1484053 RepID=A0A1M5CYC1_9BACT|nr:response regulator [Mariniphaga anaerophila]SHF59675.1 PAS domain S-box-containing protein [Mariniphaga anaerophila]